MSIGDWIQVAVAVVGLSGTLAALGIASSDRRAAAQQARLSLLLDAANELASQTARFNIGMDNRADQQEANARQFAPLAILGPERMPTMWKAMFGTSSSEPNTDPGEGRKIFVAFDREAREALRVLAAEQEQQSLSRRQRRRRQIHR